MTGGRLEPRYIISIAAQMVGVHTHTLRYYERVGLVEPQRTHSNLRLYSDQDIYRLRRIRNLMDNLGVNLAGVEVILNLLERMEMLQLEISALKQELQHLKASAGETPGDRMSPGGERLR